MVKIADSAFCASFARVRIALSVADRLGYEIAAEASE
jgi:hypothetical protein